MNQSNLTIAFTIGMFNSCDGPSHCVYAQAYGMEMQVDDEWPLNILIMAPPHLVSSLTEEADVVSMGMIPGASYTPGDGDYNQISEKGGAWVVVQPSDDLSKIVEHGLGVLLVVESHTQINLPEASGLNSENLIVAFQINSVANLKSAQKKANDVRAKLPEACAESQILVSGSFETSDLLDYSKLDGVSGLLLLDASFDCVLELVEQIVG